MNAYLEVAEAMNLPGLRMVLTRGVPGPWGEAAKSILHVKKIDHVRVSQYGGEPNEALKSWIGIDNAPAAVLDGEPPRTGWVEILMLAERLAPEPSLIPRDERQRAHMFGLAHELNSEDGFGWNRRLMFFDNWRRAFEGGFIDKGRDVFDRMNAKYGYGGDLEHSRQRVMAIWRLLSAELLAQRARGSLYYIGDRLSALDIYSACWVAMVKPLPIELCPTSPDLHAAYAERDPDILAAADPILLEHRDYIYQTYLELPLRL